MRSSTVVDVLIDNPRRWRAIKARAVRFRDTDRAAEADLGLRASKLAIAIERAMDGPPFPPGLVTQFCNMIAAPRKEESR